MTSRSPVHDTAHRSVAFCRANHDVGRCVVSSILAHCNRGRHGHCGLDVRSVAHRQEVKPVTEPKKQPIYYVVFFDIDYPLFVQALVIMIVRHLHTVHELLSVLSQSTPEMQTLCSELCFEGQYPSRRTWERRLKALPASLPAQIGCLGR